MERSSGNEAAAQFEEVGSVESLQGRATGCAKGWCEAEPHHGHVTSDLPTGHVTAVGRQVVRNLDAVSNRAYGVHKRLSQIPESIETDVIQMPVELASLQQFSVTAGVCDGVLMQKQDLVAGADG